MKKSTKKIGNIGEAKVLCKFIELGYPVYIPFGDNEKADLIVEIDKHLYKIQVKTSSNEKNGYVEFKIKSQVIHNQVNVDIFYTKDDIDYFALYNRMRDKIYLVPVEISANHVVRIRYEKPKNNQRVGINLEEDYLLENVLNNMHEWPNG